MNNERIDLTQFEGHTSDWSIEEGPLPTLFITDNDGVIATMEMDAEERYVADSLLISKAPDLLAELKRCYEEIDNLLKEKNRLIDIAERCGAWDGGIDISDINEEYGACNLCGSIPSGCCEDASE